MLLAFVLFGAVLSTLVDTIALGPACFRRPGHRLSATAGHQPGAGAGLSQPPGAGVRGLVRAPGLEPLLLALLVILGDVPDAERLLAIVGVVVIASVVAHGATPVAAWYGPQRGAGDPAGGAGGHGLRSLWGPGRGERWGPG